MFAADEAVLVELHPSYRQDRHFRHAARMTGKIGYMPFFLYNNDNEWLVVETPTHHHLPPFAHTLLNTSFTHSPPLAPLFSRARSTCHSVPLNPHPPHSTQTTHTHTLTLTLTFLHLTGKIYMPLRATQRETCEGSSDNVVMPMEEFRKTIDGAIRIARNFDNGECASFNTRTHLLSNTFNRECTFSLTGLAGCEPLYHITYTLTYLHSYTPSL